MSTFDRYPDITLIDATHKTNSLQMPFFGMLAIDGNNDSQIIGAFLLIDETEDSIRSILSIFKKRNPEWNKIGVVITDKDMIGRCNNSRNPSSKITAMPFSCTTHLQT